MEILGLENEKREILDTYEREYEIYENEVALIKKDPYEKATKKVGLTNVSSNINFLFYPGIFGSTFYGGLWFLDGTNEAQWKLFSNITLISGLLLLSNEIKIEKEIDVKKDYPEKPRIKKVISDEQIKSIVRAYNNNIYNEISSEQKYTPSPNNNIIVATTQGNPCDDEKYNRLLDELMAKKQNTWSDNEKKYFEKYNSDCLEFEKGLKDVKTELKKYKEMLDDGLITQEDYDAKKKELLRL